MANKKSKKITKQNLLDDLKQVHEKLREETKSDKEKVTRNFYRKHGKYSETDYINVFRNFNNFKTLFYNGFISDKLEDIEYEKITDQDIQELETSRKILALSEENKKIKKDKDILLKKSLKEEVLIDLYSANVNSNYDYPLSTKKIKTESKGKKAILVISDVHLGAVVNKEEVNHVNEFNKTICIERLNEVFRKFILICAKNKIADCHIFFNGDLLEGGLRDESTRNSDLNEVESLFYMQQYLILKLSELTEHFNTIDVDFLVGNHGRILQGRPYFSEKVSMNWENILGKQVKLYFDSKKINKLKISIPESAFIVREVNNNRFLVTHGDIFTGAGSGGFGGIPFYSILSSSAKFYGVLHQIGMENNISFDNIILGHLHTSYKIPAFNGGYVYGNGCVIGTDPFGLYKMRSVAKKEQLVLIIQKNGMISHEMCIKFE